VYVQEIVKDELLIETRVTGPILATQVNFSGDLTGAFLPEVSFLAGFSVIEEKDNIVKKTDPMINEKIKFLFIIFRILMVFK
jgi:hypothetical protein